MARDRTTSSRATRKNTFQVSTLQVIGFIVLMGSVGYASAVCDMVVNINTPYSYSGCYGDTYTYNGIIENACAYDTTNKTGDGESYNCCNWAINSAGVCMKQSQVVGIYPANGYACYPKSTSGQCPRAKLICGGTVCNGGTDTATACKVDPYSPPYAPVYKCANP